MADQAPTPRPLPERPRLDHLKKQAKQLLAAAREAEPNALRRFAALDLPTERPTLHDAQLVIAREHGFASWRRLKARVDASGGTADGRREAVDAALAGDVERMRAVLDAHPEAIHATGGAWDKPLLHLAAWGGHLEVVDELLRREVDANARCRTDNAYALHFAAEAGHLDVVKRLVEAGADVNGEGDDHEMGVLGWAVCLGGLHEDVAAYLMERGARLHIFSAVALDRVDQVRRMVKNDPTLLEAKMSRNEHHRRPLHLAVAKNRPAVVKLLLELGADVHAEDDTGATALTYAAGKAVNPDIVTTLESAGATLNLLTALSLGRYDVAEALVQEDPSRIGGDGRDTIALHAMIDRGDAEAVRWLIEHGIDVNAKRSLYGCNCTALHLCIELKRERPEILALLLEAGADPNIRDDKYNSTALGWAEYLGRPELAELIRVHGGD